MTTSMKNVRGLARTRGYRLVKIRDPWDDDAYRLIDPVAGRPVQAGTVTLSEAEAWLRKRPTLEAGR